MGPIVIVDADSILHIVAWNLQDCEEKFMVEAAMEGQLATIRAATGSDQLLLCIDSGVKCFRYGSYRFAPYKGTRSEKPEYYKRLEPTMYQYLKDKGALCVPGLEADDLVAYAARMCREAGVRHIVSSPDKDIQQIPGLHFNYGKVDRGSGVGVVEVAQDLADFNFWCQMITGDTNDNIKGIPGLGIVNANKILKAAETEDYRRLVKEQYLKCFGEYYGNIIFEETYWALRMVDTNLDASRVLQSYSNWVNPLVNFENYVQRIIDECGPTGKDAIASEPGEIFPFATN